MEDTTFIGLLKDQRDDLKKDFKKFIELTASLNHANMINEIDPIKDALHDLVEADVKRNGRIDDLETETRPTRWIYRNPGKAVIVGFITLMLSAFAYHKIDMTRTLEKTVGVIMRSDEVTVVERGPIE